MLRSTLLAILLIGPLAGNAQAMNWFSAWMPSVSEAHHTAGPALIHDSQPELAGSQYSSVESMPVSHSYGHENYSDGDAGCSSCGSNYSDLWAGYCSKKHGQWFGGHAAKCCKPKCHKPKCHRQKCCRMEPIKSKCHSCWGHLSHWFHKSSNCSSCGNHEAGHYEGEVMESDGEIIPTPMEDSSPSDRAASKSAGLKLLPASLKLWPVSFGL